MFAMPRPLVPLVVATMLALAMPTLALARPTNAGPPQCRVADESTGAELTSKDVPAPLQQAIDAAAPGTTLQVMGHCASNVSISKDLVLRGKATAKLPMPTLDAGGCGTVVTITSAVVSISDLTITNGDDGTLLGCGGNGFGGGIVNNAGTVMLANVSITANHSAGSGGGIFNAGGFVSLSNATVTLNTAFTAGGGILTSGGTLTIEHSTISGNGALMGGGIYSDGSTVSLTSSAVSDNTVIDIGGGIVDVAGDLMLLDTMITGNVAGSGGGIATFAGSLTLSGATSIESNTATTVAGGILSSGTTISASDWTGGISGNSPQDCDPALSVDSAVCN